MGSDGLFLHYDGLQWTALNPSPSGINLYSLWGSGSEDVSAGGELGTILHYDGDVWSVLDDAGIPTTQTIMALWGASSTDIFAAGTHGDIFRYDGNTCTLVANTGFELYTLWGSGADNVFAAGENGRVYHYDGNSSDLWEEVAGFTGQGGEDIHASWGSTSGRVYFTGSDGRIFLYTGEDHLPPQVIAVELSTNNDGRAYVPTEVVFHFSEGMDPASITGSTVTFMQGSTVVGGSVGLSDSTTTVTLTGSLQYDTAYKAVVRGGASGVKDSAVPGENALAEDYTVTFTTEESPADGGGGVDGGCFISSALSQAHCRHQAMIRMPWARR